MTPRYTLYPGPVISQTDGEHHHVSANCLAALYRVNPRDCLVVTQADLCRFDRRDYCACAADLVALHPRGDGNYSLPVPAPLDRPHLRMAESPLPGGGTGATLRRCDCGALLDAIPAARPSWSGLFYSFSPSTMTNRLSQKTDLRDYIKVYPGALSAQACESIVARFDAAGAYEEHRNPLYSFDQINCNQVPGFGDVATLVAQAAQAHALRYFDALGLSIKPAITGFEHIRLKRYLAGRDQFREHVDVADHASARRFLVCMIYLRDNKAGQTVFPGLGVTVPCRQGAMAVFPPLWMFPHAGRAPVGVPKYTACTLLHYSS